MASALGSIEAALGRKKVGDRWWICGGGAAWAGKRWLRMERSRDGGFDMVTVVGEGTRRGVVRNAAGQGREVTMEWTRRDRGSDNLRLLGPGLGYVAARCRHSGSGQRSGRPSIIRGWQGGPGAG